MTATDNVAVTAANVPQGVVGVQHRLRSPSSRAFDDLWILHHWICSNNTVLIHILDGRIIEVESIDSEITTVSLSGAP